MSRRNKTYVNRDFIHESEVSLHDRLFKERIGLSREEKRINRLSQTHREKFTPVSGNFFAERSGRPLCASDLASLAVKDKEIRESDAHELVRSMRDNGF